MSMLIYSIYCLKTNLDTNEFLFGHFCPWIVEEFYKPLGYTIAWKHDYDWDTFEEFLSKHECFEAGEDRENIYKMTYPGYTINQLLEEFKNAITYKRIT
jgi:hypothetical protein